MRGSKQALNYLLRDLEQRRGAVAETEREWAAALGDGRFGQLRELHVELNDVVADGAARSPSA